IATVYSLLLPLLLLLTQPLSLPAHILLYPFFFFFTDTATPDIYTLSLHDALPILSVSRLRYALQSAKMDKLYHNFVSRILKNLKDRKSTRLNSSHVSISYAVFCLKKKK